MGDQWEERDHDQEARWGAATVGILLIGIGVAFLALQQLSASWNGVAWPLFVIVPGVVLLLIGLAIPHEAGLGLAIPGGMATAVGLVLAYQQYYDAWASWFFAWALVAPGAVGVTMTLFSLLHRRWDMLEAGLIAAAAGLGLFTVLGLFFVDVLGVGGGNQPAILQQGLPVLAIVLGVMIVIANLLPRHGERAHGAAWAEMWRPRDSGPGDSAPDQPK
jgi:hypothetical protein